MKLGEYGPGKSEQFARGMSFVMGRKIGLNFFNHTEEQAYQFAKQFVMRTNYGYGVGDRPRILTGAIGTGFGLFKNWPAHYIATFGTYVDEAATHGIWKPLLWSMAGTGIVGGAGGVPLYGALDSMSKVLSDTSLTDNIYEMMGHGPNGLTRMTDTFVYGLPALLGVSIQARAAAPGSHFVRDVGLMTSLATWDRAVAVTDFIGDGIDRWSATGQSPFTSQKVKDDFVRAFAPRSLQRWYAISSEGILRSLRTGNRLQSELTGMDRALSTLGFTPIDVEKAFQIGNDLYADAETTQAANQKMSRALAEAWSENDSRLALSVLRQALSMGLDIDSVARGASVRLAKGFDNNIERQYNSYVVAQRRKLVGLE